MTMTLRSAALIALSLPLAGCISFGDKPPPTLMTLTPATPVAPGAARSVDPARAVQVNTPTVPQALASLRVPVQASDTGVAYLKDAQWSEAPNRLFRTLLSEVIAGRTGRAVLDPRTLTITPGIRIGGSLKAFGLDARSNSVVVTFDGTMARGDAAVELRRFEARVPVAAPDAANVAPALNQAANQVATEVSDWVGG
jgi:cholesterol transport system auxiliary component